MAAASAQLKALLTIWAESDPVQAQGVLELLHVLSCHHGKSPTNPLVMCGTVKKDHLAALVEQLSVLAQHGALWLGCKGEEAVLWFSKGSLHRAVAGQAEGREAVRRCLSWPEAAFFFYELAAAPAVERNFLPMTGVTGVLLDVLREMDEERRKRKITKEASVNSTLARQELSASTLAELIRLTTKARQILAEARRADIESWYFKRPRSESSSYWNMLQVNLNRIFQLLMQYGLKETAERMNQLSLPEEKLDMITDVLEQQGIQEARLPDEVDWSLLEEA